MPSIETVAPDGTVVTVTEPVCSEVLLSAAVAGGTDITRNAIRIMKHNIFLIIETRPE